MSSYHARFFHIHTMLGYKLRCQYFFLIEFNFVNKANLCTVFLSMFISFLYVFRVTMYPSSGERTLSMWHLVLVTLCGWQFGMHTWQSSTHSDKYQVSHRYSCFSWWWANSLTKHVEKWNKHTKKNCAPSWLYLQDYTVMHSQRNIKFEWISS
jgi:hypothetical protein